MPCSVNMTFGSTAKRAPLWETPDGESWPLHVVAPVESVEGGWPVLVTFHGAASGTSASGMAAVATSGVVVVGPRWAIPQWNISNLESIGAANYVDGHVFDVAKCALGAAQQAAAGVHRALGKHVGRCEGPDPVRATSLTRGTTMSLLAASLTRTASRRLGTTDTSAKCEAE